jgi:hypothetical protein
MLSGPPSRFRLHFTSATVGWAWSRRLLCGVRPSGLEREQAPGGLGLLVGDGQVAVADDVGEYAEADLVGDDIVDADREGDQRRSPPRRLGWTVSRAQRRAVEFGGLGCQGCSPSYRTTPGRLRRRGAGAGCGRPPGTARSQDGGHDLSRSPLDPSARAPGGRHRRRARPTFVLGPFVCLRSGDEWESGSEGSPPCPPRLAGPCRLGAVAWRPGPVGAKRSVRLAPWTPPVAGTNGLP